MLNDRQIRQLVEERGMIAPFVAKKVRKGKVSYGLSSFGYDLRLSAEIAMGLSVTDTALDPKGIVEPFVVDAIIDGHVLANGAVMMLPGQYWLARSLERLKMPEDVLAIPYGKSTYARLGIAVNMTPIEPGWEGHLTIALHNAGRHCVYIYPGEGIAQVIFYRADSPDVAYEGSYQGTEQIRAGGAGQ